MATDRRIDLARRRDPPVHEREVLALHRAPRELAHEIGLRCQRLRHDEQAGGVLVEAMDDAGARDPRERGRVVKQRVGERAVAVAGPGVDDDAGRLVDDDDCVVLVHDPESDRLRCIRVANRRERRAEDDPLAAPDLALHVGARRIDGDAPRAHPRLEPAAGMFREQARERAVEPQAGQLGGNGPLDRRAIILTLRLIVIRHDTHRG